MPLPAPASVPAAVPAAVKANHTKAPEWAGPDGFALYEEDVEVWLMMTTLSNSKKGGAMRIALSGVALEAARTVSVGDLMTDGGYKQLLTTVRVAF